ncbi:hypothetical protein [Amycolatopsis sp. DG1A-15b]|uniref:hypothetical protein n=1 Tax=Amycolatopsis sp. DG1A-15b TaxID=3052846 RepID=UPI00255BB0E9|nr:hypothetical protein [Amycolatopsis sp. DG1A-15b]WIX85728.1 hypothetical protein QRY02_31555 [Amycolatopsis sp. DG1A-15b]
MDEVLNSTLRMAVLTRLDHLDSLARDADEPSKAVLADTVIARLTAAWRELLAAHAPDHRGRCRACATRWGLRRAECSVWRTAHRHLVSDSAQQSPRVAGGRHQLRSA